MSIRKRLNLSFMAMVVIPIILFLIAGFLILTLFIGDLGELNKLLPESHNYKQTASQESELFVSLKEKSFQAPLELLDENYLLSLQADLERINAVLAIRHGSNFIYTSKDLADITAMDLPEFGYHSSDNNIEKIGDKTYAIKQQDFFIPNVGNASLFFIKDASILTKLTQTIYPVLFVTLLLILVITNGTLTYYVSRSIINPIDSLKNAARKIKSGDLNHAIEIKGKDELTELAQTFEDMRKQLKESAALQAQYEENRKELIAHISHDLKTPITSIKGYIEGIQDGVATSPERLQRYLQTIYQKSNDLDHLIDELFLYSKLDLKKVPFTFEIVDLKDYLTDYLEELNFDFEKTQTKVRFTHDGSSEFLVQVDRDKIKRVLSNIIENSLKYMDKADGNIDINLRSIKDCVKIEITDNGPGIASDALPYVFHQFYRAEQSRNKQTGGSGLGLSIARMIVEEHNGEIEIESQLNKGTKIIISLRKVSR
ncbi:ATP-binding protein [Mesobacillus maritimus]|uniref:sensor histidine kinase n=1 Tax=Mesobacillus maritimus TaxID=1643336 RepID=UPI00384A67CD